MFAVLLLGYCVVVYVEVIHRFLRNLWRFLRQLWHFLWNHTWLLHLYLYWVLNKPAIVSLLWVSGLLVIGWLCGLYDLTAVFLSIASSLFASSLFELLKSN